MSAEAAAALAKVKAASAAQDAAATTTPNGSNSNSSGSSAPHSDADANGNVAEEDANIERGLTRIDPDDILADEADPDGVLGLESDSESNASKRTSVASAVSARSAVAADEDKDDGKTKTASSSVDVPGTPIASRHPVEALKAGGASSALAGMDTPKTPTAATARSNAEPESSLRGNLADVVAQLEAQNLELKAQVNSLNEKLVRSVQRISDLEDHLYDAHNRVSTYSVKVAELEKEREEHLAALNTGLLVEKAHVSSEMGKLMERVIEETAQRGKAESAKEQIERELEELTAKLFEDANSMVAKERLERARAQEKTNNLERSLRDTEALMIEQRKILANLQAQIDERRAADASRAVELASQGATGAGSSSTADGGSTGGASPASSLRELAPPRAFTRSASVGAVRGGSRTNGPYDAVPLLLINTVPFQEFLGFIRYLRKQRQTLAPFYNYPLHPKSSTESNGDASSSSGSSSHTSSTNPLMVGGLGLSHGLAGALSASSSHASSSYGREPMSPFAAAGLSRHRDYPTLPSNCESMVSIPNQLSSIPFLKRAQEEDSDPALRLDLAPALSWLSRRSVQSAILEGTLVIEPVFPVSQHVDEHALRMQSAHLPPAACALCGTGVVNVPLPAPGGSVGDTSSASNGSGANGAGASGASSSSSSGWASSISAVTGGSRRDPSTQQQSAASSSSASGSSSSNNSSGTLASKSSLPSLFSGFRLGGSSRERSPAPGPIQEGTDATDDAGPSTPATPIQPAFLPVPTHIFRINETASQRYLLCPHHCVPRLRAVCAFWGYIRTLERSIVLEGKRPWEDVAAAAAAAAASRGASSVPPALPPRSQTPEVKVDPVAEEVAEAVAAVTGGDDAEAKTVTEAAGAKAGQQEAEKDADAQTVVPEPEPKKDGDGDEDGDKSEEASGDDAKEEGQTSEDADGAEDKSQSVDTTDSAETARATTATEAETDEAKAADAAANAEGTTPGPNPPPLPARSTARGRAVPPPPPGTVSASAGSSATPETINKSLPGVPASHGTGAGAGTGTMTPLRTAIPMLSGTASSTAEGAGLGLALGGGAGADANGALVLGWEERAWLEIVKLKEEMWKARIGVR